MSGDVRPRLAPIPSTVLLAFPRGGPERDLLVDPGSASGLASGVASTDALRPLEEARARRELTLLLEPVSADPLATLRVVDAELQRLFLEHPRALSALRLALMQVQRATESSSKELSGALASFEELLEALVDRHGLWGERG